MEKQETCECGMTGKKKIQNNNEKYVYVIIKSKVGKWNHKCIT